MYLQLCKQLESCFYVIMYLNLGGHIFFFQGMFAIIRSQYYLSPHHIGLWCLCVHVVRTIGEINIELSRNFPRVQRRQAKYESQNRVFQTVGRYPVMDMRSVYEVVLWTELCPPQESHVEAWMPNVMVQMIPLGGGQV